jgi:hypothetical protein
MATTTGRGRQQPARRGRPTKQSTTRARQSSTPAKQSTSTSQARQSTSPARQTTRTTGAQSRSATVNLPFVTAQFRAPEVHLPTRKDVTSAVDSARSYMPPRDQALFYGALTVGAALAVIEWPVALAIGVGTELVRRGSGSSG